MRGCAVMVPRTAERREVRALKRELRRLKLEPDVLAKATAWFARESGSIPRKGFRFVSDHQAALSGAHDVPSAGPLPQRVLRVAPARPFASIAEEHGSDRGDPRGPRTRGGSVPGRARHAHPPHAVCPPLAQAVSRPGGRSGCWGIQGVTRLGNGSRDQETKA